MCEFKIGNKWVGYKHPCFVVAEISANHIQDLDKAKMLIDEAKSAGADAIKIQSYLPDSMTIDCKNDYFKIKDTGLWDDRYLYDLYKEGYLTREQQLELKHFADKIGIKLFASAFSKDDVDFLEKDMKVEVYKVASFEITDTELISYIASKGKPIIMSTGVADWADIWHAIYACTSQSNYDIALLKCSSTYPTPDEEVNLSALPSISAIYRNYVIGFSDHTQDSLASLSAVALGAKIIEKHVAFYDDIFHKKTLDSNFSIAVDDYIYACQSDEFDNYIFEDMVSDIRRIEKMIGTGKLDLTVEQKKMRNLCRSLFVVEDIKRGEKFTEKNVRSIRPGYGMHPKYYNDIIGKTTKYDIKRGTPLAEEMIK